MTFGLATAIAAKVILGSRGPAPARRALVGCVVTLVVLHIGWFTVSPTDTWLGAVRWFRAIPLT